MGADNNVYIGVYLEVKNGKRKETKVSYVNSNGNKAKSKFNSHTGEENTKVVKEVEVVDYPNPYKLSMDNGLREDEFFSPEYCGAGRQKNTWISQYGDFKIGSGYDLFNLDLSSVDIPSLKLKFMEYYKDYLESLGKDYEYEVKFGIVHYAH